MRRKLKEREKHSVTADLVHHTQEVSKFVNYLMESGKKNTARRVVYAALETVKEKSKASPLEILDAALRNTSPNMEVRSRRVGGANYQIPVEVRPARRIALSMKWIIDAARSKKGKPMHVKLAEEIIAASKNEGEAVRKRENVHKMAEANKAFAHFAW